MDKSVASPFSALEQLQARQIAGLEAENKRLRQGLWDCAIRAGFDNDGDLTPEALTHPDIVALALREVERLRKDCDEAIS